MSKFQAALFLLLHHLVTYKSGYNFKSGILVIYSSNIALLAKCISKYIEQPVFPLGRILWNIAPRECMLKYSPLRKWNKVNLLNQYYHFVQKEEQNIYNINFFDMWHVTYDMSHLTRHMWHVTCDVWHMEGGEHSLKISAPQLFQFGSEGVF